MDTPRLLVVDDDRSCRTIVAEMLVDRGYLVDTASDGFDALRMAESTPYALAVLDYQMPGMDGVELFGRLRRLQPDIQGVFLTAFATLDTVYPAIAAGVERVLAKPPQNDELLPLVEELAGTP
jgi:CheY-like chemotaxis protein